MGNNDCIFCKIVAGQIKTQVVHDDPHALAFRDINPQAPVHILVIPKKHIEKASHVSEADAPFVNGVFRTAVRIAQLENLTDKGFRLVINDGQDGGQTVPHLHMHVIGGRPLKWPPG